MRVLTVTGNRPQFIKASAVSPALRRQAEEVLVHTGQHYDDELSRAFFDELDVPRPEHELGIGGGSNTEQTARMLRALEPLLDEVGPDVVLVYGDTNSTLAGALVAAQAQIPLAHVEAGMRSFDRRARLLQPRARERRETLSRYGVEPGDFLLVTVHRAGNVDDPERLERLVELLAAMPGPLVLPLHPRTDTRLRATGLDERLRAAPGVILTPPLGYLDFTALLCHARAVLTDSGGVQKEAYLAAVPCVTLRDTTEWVETVELGWNALVDLDADAALAALERPRPSERPELYGDGRAGERVVEALLAGAGRSPS